MTNAEAELFRRHSDEDRARVEREGRIVVSNDQIGKHSRLMTEEYVPSDPLLEGMKWADRRADRTELVRLVRALHDKKFTTKSGLTPAQRLAQYVADPSERDDRPALDRIAHQIFGEDHESLAAEYVREFAYAACNVLPQPSLENAEWLRKEAERIDEIRSGLHQTDMPLHSERVQEALESAAYWCLAMSARTAFPYAFGNEPDKVSDRTDIACAAAQIGDVVTGWNGQGTAVVAMIVDQKGETFVGKLTDGTTRELDDLYDLKIVARCPA